MRNRRRLLACVLGLVLLAPAPARPDEPRPVATTPVPYPARVSENGRFLLDQFGKPFFYLGDTAWELFHRLNRDEADVYLRDRAAQRFNVIQAVILAEYGAIDPNPQGHRPLADNDPGKLVEAYFEDVDWVVRRAEALGMCVGMLPTWGDKWNKKWGLGPEIFNPENARRYGEYLGRRYRDRPVVWILGGDRPIESDRHRAILRAMAEGLRAGDGGRHLITFHPVGGRGSADWLHDEPWLDFNMCQTGHGFDHENFRRIAADYARRPVKPCLDAEPGYEDHPAEFNPKNGYLDAYETRKFAYWAVFAGACGHTYGCHDIWQFFAPGRAPITAARTPWREALALPGARQMKILRGLVESRPMLVRVPDPELIVGDPGQKTDRIAATRASDGSYAFVYSSSGRPFLVDLERLSGAELHAQWLDPRTGEVDDNGTFSRSGRKEFKPPSQGKGLDWVLVLDDASRNALAPGRPPAAATSTSAPGYHLLVATFRTGDTEIFRVDPVTGDAVNLTRSPGSKERYPSWSFDGRLVAFNSDRDGTFNLFVMDAKGGEPRQLTHEKAPIVAGMQSWTADGRWIYFGLFGGGPPRICRIHPDGTGFEVVQRGGIDPAISPDGKTVVYARETEGGHVLCAADGDGRGERRLTNRPNPFAGVHAAWSPDGRWIVFADRVGDALELFRCDRDGSQFRQLTHFGGGRAATSPAVSPDSRLISFRLCDEVYWRDGKLTERAYGERRADKRPVWIMGIDGDDPRVVEPLHYQTTIDGSRAPWGPR